jgi:hypothetical protein
MPASCGNHARLSNPRYLDRCLRGSGVTEGASGGGSAPVNSPMITRPRTLRSASASACGCVRQLPTVFNFVTDIDLRGPLATAHRPDCIAHTRIPIRAVAQLRKAGRLRENANRNPTWTPISRSYVLGGTRSLHGAIALIDAASATAGDAPARPSSS